MTYLVVVLMLAASPLYAAGPTEPAKSDDDATAAKNIMALPRSMVPQGVIGRLVPKDGYNLLDPDVLIKMRKDLIVSSDAVQ